MRKHTKNKNGNQISSSPVSLRGQPDVVGLGVDDDQHGAVRGRAVLLDEVVHLDVVGVELGAWVAI